MVQHRHEPARVRPRSGEAILLRDVWLTLIKSAIFATIIVQVGYAEGLRARGGPEAVGPRRHAR